MGKLSYIAISSLDGYIADKDGKFDWGEPDQEVHSFVNEVMRPIGTYLYGRRMYEVMVWWESMPTDEAQPAFGREFAKMWQAADKIVYSKTLKTVSSARTRIEREFNPEAVRQLKARTTTDLCVAGPELAARAFEAGLVDECGVFIAPIIVGGGKQYLPDHLRLRLKLLDERRFRSGMVYLYYRTIR
jgi:dihydrofolate reductase